MKKSGSIVADLNLKSVGLVEMLMALYPILSSYQYGPIPFSLLVLLIAIIVILLKNGNLAVLSSKDIKWLAAFVVLHDIVLMFLMGSDTPGFFINSLISFVISFAALLFIIPYINWTKFEGSINWVALISIAGLIMQYIQVQSGQEVGMLKIPFLPDSGLSRYHQLYGRPHSFFEEPVMYSQFMLIPLFIALLKKRYLWAGIISLTIFMSSSTTGLVLTFIMMLVFVFMGKMSKKSKFVIILLGGGFILLLISTDLFAVAINKFNRERDYTSVENVRLVQGPVVVSTMESTDYILGAPYANSYQYCVKRGISFSLFRVYGSGDNAMVYMTTFWQLILRFGIVGLFFYLMVYIRLFKYKELLPLTICACIMIYTASFWIGPLFVFYIISLYSFVNRNKNVRNKNCNNYMGKI